MLPLVWKCLGQPLGEAVAEDFDFLRRAVLEPSNSLLDGGGSMAFWRPVAHQIYYECLGPLILTHPRAVAALHAGLLALAAVLIYRVLRRGWPGPMAFAAASFPLLAESTRTLVAWPSHFVDLGLYLFSALALHEAAHRRMLTALPALLLALLCKEVALVTAALLPFMPGPGPPRGARMRWTIATGLTAGLWAAAYLAVRGHAGLHLPHALEGSAAVNAAPLGAKLGWGLWNSLRAVMGMSLKPGPMDGGGSLAAALLILGTLATFALDRGARERLRRARGWVSWGAVWFLLATAPLTAMYPFWMPNRSQFGSVGLGVGAVAITAVAHPALAATLVGARLALLLQAPPGPSRITRAPVDRGAFVDFPRIARLQRLMLATRTALHRRYPALPRGALVGQFNLPLAAEYAYGGSHALQAWYRDTTLRQVRFEEYRRDTALRLTTIITYQPDHQPEVVLLEPAALRAQTEAVERLQRGEWVAAQAGFDRADSLQRDTTAVVFLADNAGRRARCLAELGRFDEAESQARHAVSVAPEDGGARYVLALAALRRKERAEARAEVDTLLLYSPRHQAGLELLRILETPPDSARR